MIKNITKRTVQSLPDPATDAVESLYRRFWNSRVKTDDRLVRHLAEFHDLPEDEVVELMDHGKTLNRMLWDAVDPETSEEITEYYQITPYYTLELAHWHMMRSQQKFRQRVTEAAHGEVLVHGGGIGDLCVDLHEAGCRPTYLDVSGVTMEFARFHMEMSGIDVELHDLTQTDLGNIGGIFDTVVSIDVVEHVPNVEETVRELVGAVSDDGTLLLTINEDQTDNLPMHLDIDFDVAAYLREEGFEQRDSYWHWER